MLWQEHWKSNLKLRGYSGKKKTIEIRIVSKMKRQMKDLRQLVARAGNKIYRKEHWRKAAHK